MGLFDKLFGKKPDKDLCLIRDYIIIAKLNGESMRSAKEWILNEMEWKNIPAYKYDEVAKNPNRIKDCYPTDENEQCSYLVDLVAKTKTREAQVYAAKKGHDMGLAKSLGVI